MITYSPPAGVVAARELLELSPKIPSDGWSLDVLAGRFVEIGGGASTASLTACARLILEAQQRGEPSAWIGQPGSCFFPPDLAAFGIDLAALPVVWVSDVLQAARAADTLLRSGGFGVLLLDLGQKAELPLVVQTRLVGLAQKHHTALIAITRQERDEVSRGHSRTPLVSLRAETVKRRADHDRFAWELRIVKDKRRVPGWCHTEECRGPDGLC